MSIKEHTIDEESFIPAFGNRPLSIIGRKGFFEKITAIINSPAGAKERSSIILGQRGSGKTVLLWEIYALAKEMGYVVATPTIVADGFLDRIIEKVEDDGEKILKSKKKLAGGSIGILGFSAGVQFNEDNSTKSFGYKITQIARILTKQKKGLLILVDELQSNKDEVRNLVVAYQEMVGERLNVALVMAGLPGAVSSVLNDHVLTFLNRASKIELPPLNINEIFLYYRKVFGDRKLSLSDEQIMEASEATFGSPYMFQLVGYYITKTAAADGQISEKDFKLALNLAAVDFENDVCGTTLNAVSDKDKEFLKAMSLDENESVVADIAARMNVTVDYAQKYRKRLISVGIISVPSRGKVTFAVPYLKSYLQKH